jgi:hypothetical protein
MAKLESKLCSHKFIYLETVTFQFAAKLTIDDIVLLSYEWLTIMVLEDYSARINIK